MNRRSSFDGVGAGLLAILVLFIALLAIHPPTADAAPRPLPARGTVAYCYANATGLPRRTCIVRVLWAPFGRREVTKALAVAACESGFNPRAANGQYRGVWQMGTGPRARFGHGPTVEVQTRAAIRYYQLERREGRSGWGPWECA